ncbi:MAG: creatinine amidohydrolase [Rhodobacteraceae bacterium HLUCCA08]|nr:MAG: creatinine amidohydrolase [Rhodobacteraceae bacterium HLUCCA08]
MSRYWIELTQPEIKAQFERNPLVILPCGSVEQHGAHLPTGTDIYAANAVSHAVAERMDGVVLPGGPLGVTPMHMPYESTISLTPETYQRVLVETCLSTAQHGAKRLLIVNWHEGNSASIGLAAEQLHRTHGMSVVIAQACYVAEDLWGADCGGLTHAGEIEALAILPDHEHLVHLDRVKASSEKRQGAHMDKLRRTRSFVPILTDIRSIAPTGWYGDPQPATAERGRKMIADVADAVAKEAQAIFDQLDRIQGPAGRGVAAE